MAATVATTTIKLSTCAGQLIFNFLRTVLFLEEFKLNLKDVMSQHPLFHILFCLTRERSCIFLSRPFVEGTKVDFDQGTRRVT